MGEALPKSGLKEIRLTIGGLQGGAETREVALVNGFFPFF